MPTADTGFVTERLRPRLAGLLDGEQTEWKERGAPWSDAPRALVEFVEAGKALRPRFCYWGHASVRPARADGHRLVDACAALELLHTFALIHDDLMDGSETRRGRPALHRRLADQHRRNGWAGDSDGYGHALALLTGDLAFALANRLVTMMPERVRRVWSRLVDELTVGQFLDLAGSARQDRSLEVARTTARLKSGQYTVTGPLRLGAAIVGRPLPAELETYGELVGEAFQLRDDLLGVFGDPAVTGKPVGDDLRAGKPTELLAYAAGVLPRERRHLLDRSGSHPYTAAELDELTGQLADCGAREHVERRIAGNVEAACAALDRSAVPAQPRAALRALAGTATDRAE